MMMKKGLYHRIRLVSIRTDIRFKELRSEELGFAVGCRVNI